MTEGRNVWIVGEPEEGGEHAYHLRSCYVLDQVGNRGRERKIPLADVPGGYTPCQICAPGSRTSGTARGGTRADAPAGAQPGHVVEVEDVETGRVAEHRLAPLNRGPEAGEVSAGSRLGEALIGQPVGKVVDFNPPKGKGRKLRILHFE